MDNFECKEGIFNAGGSVFVRAVDVSAVTPIKESVSVRPKKKGCLIYLKDSRCMESPLKAKTVFRRWHTTLSKCKIVTSSQ